MKTVFLFSILLCALALPALGELTDAGPQSDPLDCQ